MNVTFNKELFGPLFWHLLKYVRDPKVRSIYVYGGSSAGKTHEISQVLALDGIIRKYSSAVFRKEQSVIKDTIKPTFAEIIDKLFSTPPLNNIYNKFDFEFRSARDTLIKFKGLDKGDKIKGLKGYRKIYLDELDQFLLTEWTEGTRRLRGDENQQRIGAWNPVSEDHWLKKDIIDKLQWVDLPNEIEEVDGFKGVLGWSKLSEDSFIKISTCGRNILIKTTYKDNKWVVGGEVDGRKYGRIDEQVIADFEDMKNMFPDEYEVYGKGNWGVTRNEKPWFGNFKKKKQVLQDIEVYEGFPILTGWDFNYSRMACIVGQKIEFDRLNIIDVIRGMTIEDVCHELDRRYGDHKWGIKIYGDASGKSANAMTGAYNYFHKIKDILELPDSAFFKTHNRNKNLKHSQSRELIQWIFARIPTFFNGNTCQDLVKEIEKAQVVINEKTGLENLRKDETTFQMDMVDALRYLLENMLVDIPAVKEFREFIEINSPGVLEYWDNY